MEGDEIAPLAFESQQEEHGDEEDGTPEQGTILQSEEDPESTSQLPKSQKLGAEWSLFTDIEP